MAAGFRVAAPDMRGYNLSSRPKGVKAYDIDQLTADIRGLIQERGADSALLDPWHLTPSSGGEGSQSRAPFGRSRERIGLALLRC